MSLDYNGEYPELVPDDAPLTTEQLVRQSRILRRHQEKSRAMNQPTPDPAVEAARDCVFAVAGKGAHVDHTPSRDDFEAIIRRHFPAKDAGLERLIGQWRDDALDQAQAIGDAQAIIDTLRSDLAAVGDTLTALFDRGLIVAKRGPFCSTECLSTCNDCKAIDDARRTLAAMKVKKP